MEKQGWISLHRKIEDHWLLKKRSKSQFEAWIIILLEANHNSEKIYIDGSLIECKRGESIKSLKTWANLFGWSRSKVSRFFNLLEKDNMIVLKSERKTTHLKICNYNTYQDGRNKDETKMKQRWNDHETIMDTNNNDNNDNNENKEEAATLWKSVFLNNPGKVELDFVEYLQTKFNGNAKRILYSLRENNFHSIRKMKDALDEFGNIKPIEKNDDNKTLVIRT